MTLLDTKEGREAVAWAIRISQMGEVALASGQRSGKTLRREAMAAVHDPAKLAELMASEGRRLDVLVPDIGHGGTDWHVNAVGEEIVFDGCIVGTSERFKFTMPRARTILVTLLQLPNSAREQAERVLRGEP